MKYAIQAYFVKDSNEIYWNKNFIKNAEEKEIEEITIYLFEKEIAALYAVMNQMLAEERDKYDYDDEIEDYTEPESEYSYEELQKAWFDVD